MSFNDVHVLVKVESAFRSGSLLLNWGRKYNVSTSESSTIVWTLGTSRDGLTVKGSTFNYEERDSRMRVFDDVVGARYTV